ncbi:hypothetical protein PQ610_02085 [Tardisphaera miroshnichenkoae]
MSSQLTASRENGIQSQNAESLESGYGQILLQAQGTRPSVMPSGEENGIQSQNAESLESGYGQVASQAGGTRPTQYRFNLNLFYVVSEPQIAVLKPIRLEKTEVAASFVSHSPEVRVAGGITARAAPLYELELPLGSMITDEAKKYIERNSDVIPLLKIIAEYTGSRGGKLNVYIYRDPEEPSERFTVEVVLHKDIKEILKTMRDFAERVGRQDPKSLSKIGMIFSLRGDK